MASPLPSFCTTSNPSSPRIHNMMFIANHSQLKCQSCFNDEGPRDIVDANMSVLRLRVEEVRRKERLNRYCRHENGWSTTSSYGPGAFVHRKIDCKGKKETLLSESLGLMGLVSGTLGLVFFSGSLTIYLVSLLVHLHH